jgi:hypothetical protein
MGLRGTCIGMRVHAVPRAFTGHLHQDLQLLFRLDLGRYTLLSLHEPDGNGFLHPISNGADGLTDIAVSPVIRCEARSQYGEWALASSASSHRRRTVGAS